MNKTDIIDAIAEKAKMSKKDAAQALDALIETVTESLSQGDEIRLQGFGTFKVNERAARTGRNPATKETIEIPATKVPVFRAGKEFKEKIKA